MSYDVIVVGGGPAGIIAAGIASLRGAKTLLLEEKESLTLSLTESLKDEDILTDTSRRLQFQNRLFVGGDDMETALKLFSATKFCTFLDGLGFPVLRGEEEEILFGEGGKEQFIAMLTAWVERTGTTISCETRVTSLNSEGGLIAGVTTSKGEELKAERVVLTTGAPVLKEQKECITATGHHVSETYPSLFSIHTTLPEFFHGETFMGSRLYLWNEGRKVVDYTGALFVKEGELHGLPALNMSRSIAPALGEIEKLTMTIDLLPQIDDGDLKVALNDKIAKAKKGYLLDVLKEYVSDAVAQYIITESCGLEVDVDCVTLSKAVRKKILGGLKRLELPLSKVQPTEGRAISGGVSLDEINSETLESYVASGLFFAGAVLNCDGEAGGYNLQLAISTGHLAGTSAAQ